MNDAEFRRRAHALLERCVVREEATGTKWTGELRALLADGAAHRTCDCAYPPAHRPECPELRGTALDVAMRAARAREVAAAGGTSFTTHDMSSRPVTINLGRQPRCGVAPSGIAPRNEPAGAMGCDPSGRPGNDAEVDRGGDARPAAAGNIAPDRTIAPDSAFAPDDAEARKAHPCRHPVIISKRNGLPLSYCGRPKGHAGPHME